MAETVIAGVFTNVGRVAMAQSILGPLKRPPYNECFFKYFRIGTGGYILNPNGSKSPITPDPAREQLVADQLGTYAFQKDFVVNDLNYILEFGTPYALVRSLVDFPEANDDGLGNSPEFFEIGLFDENDVMLVYATFPGETKNISKTLSHNVKCNF